MKAQKNVPFYEILAYLVRDAKCELFDAEPRLAIFFEKNAIVDLEQQLIHRLLDILGPSLAFELNIARISGSLKANTPKRRYNEFLGSFLASVQPILAFLKEYPLLKNSLKIIVDQWIKNIINLINRLETDRSQIQNIFNKGNFLGPIASISKSLSRQYNHGQSIYLILFASGLRLIYKCKDISLEKEFQNLIFFMNNHHFTPALPTFQILNKENYGWCEFIPETPCLRQKEMQRYYFRFGVNLCLFYFLQGIDGHVKNIRSFGEFPILIDLETIFYASIETNEKKHSVDSTGLLPFPQKKEPFKDQKFPKWKKINTDEMCLINTSYKSFPSHAMHSRKNSNSYKTYVTFIVNGFEYAFDFFIKNKHEIMSNPGPLHSFGPHCTRSLIRKPQIYDDFLSRLSHPHMLRDPILYQKECDKLKLCITKDNTHLLPMIEKEKEILQQHCIPLFHIKPGKRDLFFNGKCLVKNVIQENSLTSVLNRIENANGSEKRKQIKRIYQAFLNE